MKKIYSTLSLLFVLSFILLSTSQCSQKQNSYAYQQSDRMQLQERHRTTPDTQSEASQQGYDRGIQSTPRSAKSATGTFTPSKLQEGHIGCAPNTSFDNPADNVFKIDIDGSVDANSEVWLEYELYGVMDHTAVSMGINDNISHGGLVVKKRAEWSTQREKLNATDLRAGSNIIRFAAADEGFPYRVRNLKLNIETKPDASPERSLVLNQPVEHYFYEGYGYIKGFVQGPGFAEAKIYFNQQEVQSANGSFEGLERCLMDTDKQGKIEVSAVFADGERIATTLDFNQMDVADYLQIPGQSKYLRETQALTAKQPVDLQLNKFSLSGEKGTVNKATELSVTTLRTMDMPSMDAAMRNVTGESGGFRLLPHGSTFQKALRIGIPYDSAALPTGYRPTDIRTYFFDEKDMRWVVLPLDTIDTQNQIVYSYTTHFTDFVNGIIKTPEAPQTAAYTPTSLKQLQAANPHQGINVMAPPSANNSGSANLSLPIEVPAGRKGMEPNLAISYSSDGGNGWLGMGWNLSLPSIDVDNRWGVPRYSPTHETESYLLNGKQMSDSINRSLLRQRDTSFTTHYRHRVEGSFDKIMRHGNSPTSYWWEVKDRNGLTYYYGKYHSDAGVNQACVLYDTASNNIAHWALAEVRDPHGNYIKYNYQLVKHSGTAGSSVPGRMLYPESIVYTGFGATDGKYKVSFELDSKGSRNDILVSMRNGFKEVTANRLKKIVVSFDNYFIRDYELEYKEGSYGKSLLCFIWERRDSTADKRSDWDHENLNCDNIGEFALRKNVKVHYFDYYQDTELGFEAAVDLNVNLPNDNDTAFSLSKTSSKPLSFSGGVGVGLATDIFNKDNSLGGNYTRGYSWDKVKRMFIDIDGDGLPDLVRNKNGTITYNRLIFNNGTLQFEGTARNVSNLSKIGHSISKSNTFGGEGSFGKGDAQISASVAHTKTSSYEDIYFSDVNADGNPDLILEQDVYINHSDGTGDVAFVKETGDVLVFPGDPCNFLLRTQGINDSIFMNRESGDSYGRDAVRMWIAPKSGSIKIMAPIQLLQEVSYNRSQSKLVDGIVYQIEQYHNATQGMSIIDMGGIGKDDYAVKESLGHTTTVNKGDYIFFRLRSKSDRSFDRVQWSPVIYYQNADTTLRDPDGKRVNVYSAKEDFLLNNKMIYMAPFQGKIRVKGSISADAQSDTLYFHLMHNSQFVNSATFPDNQSFTHQINEVIDVVQGDYVNLVAFANTSVNLTDIQTDFELYYIESDSVHIDTTSAMDHFHTRPMVQFNHFHNPKQWGSPCALPGTTVTLKPSIQLASNNANGTIVFAVKKEDDVLAERNFQVVNGSLSGTPSITLNLTSPETVHCDLYITDSDIADHIQSATFQVNGGSAKPLGIHAAYNDSLWKFGNLYRGWGQFSYKSPTGTVTQDTIAPNLLCLSALYRDTSLITMDTSAMSNYNDISNALNANGMNDQRNLPFQMMYPDLDSNVWMDYAMRCWVASEDMSHEFLKRSTTDTIYDSPGYIASGGSTIRVLKKESENENWSFNLGFSGGGTTSVGGSGGATVVNGTSKQLTDYQDLNGDRYPDAIGNSAVQYTRPNGNFAQSPVSWTNDIYGSSMRGASGDGGVKFPIYTRGPNLTINISPNPGKAIYLSFPTLTFKGNAGAQASLGTGKDTGNYALIDINADGLLDKLYKSGSVAMNYGYSFASAENFSTQPVSLGRSFNENVSGVYFQRSNFSWSGGLGVGLAQNFKNGTWIDINADGLPDYVYKDNNDLKCMFNYGYQLQSAVTLATDVDIHKSYSISANGSLSGTGGLSNGVIKGILNLSASGGWTVQSDKSILTDVNNDGYPDLVESNGNKGLRVRYAKKGKVNLLKKVTVPTQAVYTVDYDYTQSNFRMPQRKHVLSSLDIFDAHTGDGEDSLHYSYAYNNPNYNRAERSFYGYEEVHSKQLRSASSTTAYRTTIEKYHNDDFLFAGIKYYDVLLDSAGNTYTETKYTYNKKEIKTGTVIPADSAQCFGPYYPAVSLIDRYYYEGLANHQIHTKEEYIHGPYGNVIIHHAYGDTADASDDISSYISYISDTVNYFLSMPDTVSVRHSGQELRKRTAQYHASTGELTQVNLHKGATLSTTDISYNSYGLMADIEYPENANNQRVKYTYTYDHVVHTYPTFVVDNFGHQSSTVYNYRLGVVASTTDMTGSITQYRYFDNGRLKSIWGPNEIGNPTPLLSYEYWDHKHISFNNVSQPDSIPWARTIHYDPINTNNTFVSITMTDGLGRVIQTKKKAVISDLQGTTTEKMTVSGSIVYDDFGRPIKGYYPLTEALGTDSIFNWSTDAVAPTTTKYDILDRTVQMTLPDQTSNQVSYGFGTDAFGKKRFQNQVTDANAVSIRSYSDARGLQTSLHAPYNTVTKFSYNALGELSQSTDPEGHSTTYQYDLLGQLLQRTHPDAGTTTYTYDKAGNLLSTQTANLSQGNDYIEYDYDHNRLITVSYPENPENNAYYVYGAPYTGNQSGRLIKMQDASGVQEFKYGNLGELVENVHTFVMPAGATYTFMTQWEYDSWNRTKSITYADGEVVSYAYDNAGMLSSVQGQKGQSSYDYLQFTGYDKFGNKVRMDYGNGTSHRYTYNATNLRLSNLKTYDAQQSLIQNVSYTYDNVGNILTTGNASSVVNNMGGNYSYQHDYDSLYRLINSMGAFSGNTYEMDMSYSASGNISNKTITATTLIGGITSTLNFNHNYSYNQGQVHTVSGITDQVSGSTISFNWDANGNMTNYAHTGKQINRSLCWDEENRLMAVKDENYLSAYLYDAGGERVWKFTGAIERMTLNGRDFIDMANLNNKTLYTSPYLVMTDKDYTKHFYAENQRICSKIGGGFANSPVHMLNEQAPIANEPYEVISSKLGDLLQKSYTCTGMISKNVVYKGFLDCAEELVGLNNPEEDLFFYHGDHLGSSAWMTHAGGLAYQHLQYLPYGELFVEQRIGTWDVPYKYTGHERDNETGFDYAHARYYSSEFSLFLSVDPIIKHDESPFLYCAGNPIAFIDPNGMDWIKSADGNYRYDEEITKKTKLQKGEVYIGRSKLINVNDADGKRIYSYSLNEDGSITDSRGTIHENGFGKIDPEFESGSLFFSDKKSEYLHYADIQLTEQIDAIMTEYYTHYYETYYDEGEVTSPKAIQLRTDYVIDPYSDVRDFKKYTVYNGKYTLYLYTFDDPKNSYVNSLGSSPNSAKIANVAFNYGNGSKWNVQTVGIMHFKSKADKTAFFKQYQTQVYNTLYR